MRNRRYLPAVSKRLLKTDYIYPLGELPVFSHSPFYLFSFRRRLLKKWRNPVWVPLSFYSGYFGSTPPRSRTSSWL